MPFPYMELVPAVKGGVGTRNINGNTFQMLALPHPILQRERESDRATERQIDRERETERTRDKRKRDREKERKKERKKLIWGHLFRSF